MAEKKDSNIRTIKGEIINLSEVRKDKKGRDYVKAELRYTPTGKDASVDRTLMVHAKQFAKLGDQVQVGYNGPLNILFDASDKGVSMSLMSFPKKKAA